MNRSDKIYLSRFALDPDSEYLDLDDFDLDRDFDSDAFYDEDFEIAERDGRQRRRRFQH